MTAVTRLWPHGGPGIPYGSFAGKEEQVIVETPAQEGGGKSKRRRKYPRWVMIEGQRFRVNSPEEERALLLAMMERAREIEATGTPPEVQQAKKTLRRIKKRLPKVAQSEDDWTRQLKDMDEELLLLVA